MELNNKDFKRDFNETLIETSIEILKKILKNGFLYCYDNDFNLKKQKNVLHFNIIMKR